MIENHLSCGKIRDREGHCAVKMRDGDGRDDHGARGDHGGNHDDRRGSCGAATNNDEECGGGDVEDVVV